MWVFVCILVFFIFAIFLLIIAFFDYILLKNNTFCEKLISLDNLFNDKTSKTTFQKLKFSQSHFLMKNIIFDTAKPLFAEQDIFKNKQYLLVVSKFIDKKINHTKQTFRSKNNHIIIDELSKHLASLIIKNNKCNLFSTYKSIANKFNIKQKEDKLFKVLLGQKLIFLLSKIKSECSEISKVVHAGKTTKKLKNYKKQILCSAQIYSVANFNPNSTKLLSDIKNPKQVISDFIFELNIIRTKIKIIILYLTNIFS